MFSLVILSCAHPIFTDGITFHSILLHQIFLFLPVSNIFDTPNFLKMTLDLLPCAHRHALFICDFTCPCSVSARLFDF